MWSLWFSSCPLAVSLEHSTLPSPGTNSEKKIKEKDGIRVGETERLPWNANDEPCENDDLNEKGKR